MYIYNLREENFADGQNGIFRRNLISQIEVLEKFTGGFYFADGGICIIFFSQATRLLRADAEILVNIFGYLLKY